MSIFLYDNIKGDSTEKQLFQAKVIKYANMLNIDPSWLMCVMYFESRLNPQAVNNITGATGLIQFMPATANYLGTSTTALKQMTGSEQLDYVYSYLKTYIGRMKSLTDVYLTVFYPYAVGKPNNYILGSQTGEEITEKIAQQNKIFDTDLNGELTKGEVANYFVAWCKSIGFTGDTDKQPQQKKNYC